MLDRDGKSFKNQVVKLTKRGSLKTEVVETILEGIPSINAAHQAQALTIHNETLYVNVGDVNKEVTGGEDR